MGNCVDKPDHPLIPIFQMPELSLDCFWNWFANISQMANLGLCERVGVHPSIDFLRHLVNLLFQFSVRRGTIIQTAQVNLHGSAARTQSFNPARDFLVDEVWSREFCCKGVLRSDLQLAMHSICAASAITGITHILGLLIKKSPLKKSFYSPWLRYIDPRVRYCRHFPSTTHRAACHHRDIARTRTHPSRRSPRCPLLLHLVHRGQI